jgi:hypothetical protein
MEFLGLFAKDGILACSRQLMKQHGQHFQTIRLVSMSGNFVMMRM